MLKKVFNLLSTKGQILTSFYLIISVVTFIIYIENFNIVNLYILIIFLFIKTLIKVISLFYTF
jgi:hypothetical protein